MFPASKLSAMELSTPSASTTALYVLCKTLSPTHIASISRFHRHLVATRSRSCLRSRLIALHLRRVFCTGLQRSVPLASCSPCLNTDRFNAIVARSASSFSTGGGGGEGFGGLGGNGGGDSKSGGEGAGRFVVGGAEEVSTLSSDVIILDVRGMTCGGCAASVKRILESQPQVSAVSVNLATETAIVWPIFEAKVEPNWQRRLGESLATYLTSCGFESNLRDAAKDNFFQVLGRKIDEKHNQLKESGRGLAVSWALCAVCLFGHFSHFFGAKAAWIHAFHSTGFHLSLSLFTLLGPGRQLIVEGIKSLIKGAPNMNTLVGLGALSSFTVSSLAVLVPKLGWKAFFEEPVMLIAFVLLGRNLEQRAKIKAASDMTSLLTVLPSKARLVVKDGIEELNSTVEVPSNNLSLGDEIVILPGDRIPADGIVREGRSAVDESSLTGEPLPVTKLPGAEVAAGTINLNGVLTVEVRRPGGETAIGDIIRLVEEAQSREAPVQRLADKVAGHFAYGVMAFSAATFLYWSIFGAKVLPSALLQGSSISLALQLSCSVLVVACPCALGLATPTAVLVGTSLGAKKGLFLRGGNILEKFSMVDTVVFDKTGTLTIGRPVVTNLVTYGCAEDTDSGKPEIDVLTLAAGVESNTIHPIGKAILDAARAANCQNVKAEEGTFLEEPGSGAVATIGNKRVSVGTLDWVQRHGVTQKVEEDENQSVVYVGIDDVLAGLIYIEDQIREDAAFVVENLQKQGISVYMLSGDKRSTAEHVASSVGITTEHVMWGVKPASKEKFIRELQKDGNIVAMVGDGINDAAALAASHVGVAMGGGVGAASEVSSIVLMGNKLSQVVDALELSKLTMRTVRENLWWAFTYNLVGIPIAAGALLPMTGIVLTPSIAGGLMGLSSIGVMTNSLLLRLKFSSKHNISDIAHLLNIKIDSNSQR